MVNRQKLLTTIKPQRRNFRRLCGLTIVVNCVLSFIFYCIFLSAFVGLCCDCKNMLGMSNINLIKHIFSTCISTCRSNVNSWTHLIFNRVRIIIHVSCREVWTHIWCPVHLFLASLIVFVALKQMWENYPELLSLTFGAL
jgi:hypothetical protein